MAPPLKKPKSDHDSDPKTPSSSSNDDEPPPPIASKPSSSNAKKRSLEESQKHSKKKKKILDGDEAVKQDKEEEIEEKKKKKKKSMLIQRLWSDEDEIVILEGMIKNKKNGGVVPLSNLKQFLESIKKSLQVKKVKQEQLRNKIKRLKKKFVNNSKRAKGDEDPVFSKPHEKLSYTLMKEIWGSSSSSSGGNYSGVVVADGKDIDDDFVVVTNVKRSSSRIRKSQNAAAGNPVQTKWKGISMMELEDENGAKKGDLEGKWRCLIADELKLYLRRLELVREQTVAILDAYKSLDASKHE